MDSALLGLPLATLQSRLTEALDALHKLELGQAEVSVGLANGTRVQYTEASSAALRAYINALQNAIAAKQQGGASRQPIYLTF